MGLARTPHPAAPSASIAARPDLPDADAWLRIEVDTAVLTNNMRELRRSMAPHVRVMAVVKADGYGHGLERVAHALEGADAFGVAAIGDAERLRAAGISKRVVLLSGFDEAADLPALQRLGIESVLHHEAQLRLLELDGA